MVQRLSLTMRCSAGTIYTGFIDWDIIGNTIIIVYRYTCDSPSSHHVMPDEFWFKQPATPQRYSISSQISIVQTGEGNWNKELRVAAFDSENRVNGYLFKNVLVCEA